MSLHSMRSSTKTTTTNSFRRAIIAVISAFVFAMYPAASAMAVTLNDQIKSLENEVAGYQAEAGRLRSEANTLQNALAALNAQQAALQTQIQQKELELEQLKVKIAETETRITNQEAALARNLKSMYIESDTSLLEQVFSSKSIGDYIDKAEYRNKIRDGIQKAIKEIRQLKADLEKQKASVELVLADQKVMRDQLAAQENEKNTLLAQTQGQEAAYQAIVGQKNSEIENLRAQQRAINRKSLRGSIDYSKTTSYPWPNASMNYNDSCQYPNGSSGSDDWGYCLRQCTSYVAWRLARDGASGFSYLGHAGTWAYSGQGIPTRNAQHGDVLVWPVGGYGHVMYVEDTSAEGIYISEFNYDWDGRYSERVVPWSQIDSGGYKVRRF